VSLAEIAKKMSWTPGRAGVTVVLMSIDIVFLGYPGLALLDLAGPLEALHAIPGARVQVVAKERQPFAADTGVQLVPGGTCAEVRRADVLCVPGGAGQLELMEDGSTLDWIRTVAGTARYVTSVCTGAFLLGAAGLLRGYRATTHWASLPLLASYGATPVEERVVLDRDRLTGAGVTAGMDLALRLAELLSSRTVAEAIQLGLEYDPAPPFQSGHPRSASPAVVEQVRKRFAARLARRTEQARRHLGDPTG
jgi:cyclohexyl-isocyanide hydratase